MTDAELREIEALNKARTQGEWFWDSYSAIEAEVPKGSPLDYTDANEGCKGVAYIAGIPQAPEYRGHGDELHNEETRANAVFIAACSIAVPKLLAEVRSLREQMGLILDGAAAFADECVSCNDTYMTAHDTLWPDVEVIAKEGE